MPRAEVGTPKYIANKMKSKGLQRLRWFCQVCQKQCRDENGFKCHSMSEGHLRQMLVVGESAGKHIADYSSQFSAAFVALLSRRYGTKRVKANTVYQEYISDKTHLHMNATRWVTLTAFCHYLGRAGICHVDETEKGWFIAWIDNSPKALAKAEAHQKKERMKMGDEQRERLLLSEQLERAKEQEEAAAAETGPSGSGSGSGSGDDDAAPTTTPAAPVEELKRDEKVVIGFSLKPTADAAPSAFKMNPLKPKPAAAPAANLFKRPNVFKAASAAPAPSVDAESDVAGKKRPLEPMSAAERLMHEDQERKRRRLERQGPVPVR